MAYDPQNYRISNWTDRSTGASGRLCRPMGASDRISYATWLPLGTGAELQLPLIEWFQWYLARKVNNFSNWPQISPGKDVCSEAEALFPPLRAGKHSFFGEMGVAAILLR